MIPFSSQTIQVVDPATAVGVLPILVDVDEVLGIRPNPSNGSVSFEFETRAAGQVGVEIFDVSGRIVRRWKETFGAGGHKRIVWDGRGGDGQSAADGLYFVRLSSPGRTIQGRTVHVSR